MTILPRAANHVAVLLLAAGLTGCTGAARTPFADAESELLRSLTIRCYQENREILLRSTSPAPRLACREWAKRRVARF